MRRTIRPAIEGLEGKALLSGMASGLAASLTAAPQASATGTEVVFTFTETNVTNHDVNLIVGPTNDSFVVSQDGKPVWTSNAGIEPDFLINETIKPGQSFSLHSTWDARSNQVNPNDPSREGPPLSGKFTVSNELDQGGHTTPFIVAQPSTAKPTHITPPRPPIPRFH